MKTSTHFPVLIVFWLAVVSGQAFGQESQSSSESGISCPNYDLRSGSMAKVSVRDQGSTDTCYGQVGAELFDYILSIFQKDGENQIASSGLEAAYQHQILFQSKPGSGGASNDALEALYKVGSCPESIVSSAATVKDEYGPQAAWDKIEAACRGHRVKSPIFPPLNTDAVIKKQEGLNSDGGQLVPEMILEELDAAAKSGRPIAVGICEDVFWNPASRGVFHDPQREGVTGNPPCSKHATLIIGARPKGASCEVLIQDSHGTTYNDRWKALGKSRFEAGRVWVPIDKLSDNLIDMAMLKPGK